MKRTILVFILMLTAITLSPNVPLAQTNIGGGYVFGIWTVDNSPYLINDDIEIPDDSVLAIEPGVRIEFQGHYVLNVQGVLRAIGTESDSITFTVNDTSGFSDPNSTTGGWGGIRIIDPDITNDSTKLYYCKFEYAKAVGDVWHINAGGALTIINFDKVDVSYSMFTNNSAGGDSSEVPSGGAIHLAWSDILIVENTFNHNRAESGGAIQMHESNPSFMANIFENNIASNNGGAIAVGWKSTTRFAGDRFEYNSAKFNGGAIACWDSTKTNFTNVLLRENKSNDGGAIYSTSANLIFLSSTFLNNGATHIGGGINSFKSHIQLDSCLFGNDTASVFGGGVGFYESEVKINNSEFNDNYSGILGGAMHSDFSSIDLDNSNFYRDTSDSGGAIFTWFNDLVVSSCTFSDNSAKYNSGAIYTENGNSQISDCSFNNNRSVWGGAVGFYNDTTIIRNSIFFQNAAEHGGALNSGFSNLNLSNLTFEENRSIWGGGASFGNCDLEVDSSIFIKNYATNNAGGIEYFTDTLIQSNPYAFKLYNTTFDDNFGYYRGALEINQREPTESILALDINNCNFLRNSADRGSNIFINGIIDDFQLSNSIIGENNSVLRTSGCQFSSFSNGTVTNSLFYSNQTAGGGSAASVGTNAKVAFINCTFANNKGSSGAALTQRRTSSVVLLNTIMWANEPISCTVNAASDTIGCDLNIFYSDIQYGLDSIIVNDSISVVNWSIGNVDFDPFFVDTLNSNFRISDSSLCLGIGELSVQIEGTTYYNPPYDLEMTPRPSPENSRPDLGAYENSNGSMVSISEESFAVDKFELFQNYPNPFNPSTKIRYSIPNQCYVKLKVSDLTGREIATFVSKEQPQGNYEIELNGAKLATGIYFYTIHAGKYIKTKKMVLIK